MDIALTAWSLAQLEYRDTPLLDDLSQAAVTSLAEFQPRNLANTSWAFAVLEFGDEPLFVALADSVCFTMEGQGRWKPQELSATAWAFAQVHFCIEPLNVALATAAMSTIDEFSSQSLANMSWSLARQLYDARPLLEAIAVRSAERIAAFNSQELANTAWAFALLLLPDTTLFAAISSQVECNVGKMSFLGLTNISWAFTRAGIAGRAPFGAVAAAGTEVLVQADTAKNDVGGLELSNLAWSFASFAFLYSPLMAALSAEAKAKITDFGAQNLAMMAWSWSALAVIDWPLLAVIASTACSKIGDPNAAFSEMEIASLLWSIATFPVDFLQEKQQQDFLVSLSTAPSILRGHWSGHFLCQLANALHKVRHTLDPELWRRVENAWLKELQDLADELQVLPFPVKPEEYISRLQATGCYHAGPNYTADLLDKINVAMASKSFLESSRTKIREARESGGTGSSGILCVTSFNISLPQGPGMATTKLFHSETSLQASELPVAYEALVPAALAHDRSHHAEFRSMVWLLQTLREAGVDMMDKEERQLVTGKLLFYVTHHPCLSCIGAIAQIRAALPNLEVALSYDWRPGVARGQRGD
mmetsp:Transcript_3879/g.6824  ORF Transcript_3879/g.6824 Transcript_3879/m.6824 type:complete len:591 (+) Transcript_3879:455-2227(+)